MMNISYDWRPPYQSCKLVIRAYQLTKVFIHNLFPGWQFLLQRSLSSLWTKPRTRRRSFNVEPRVPRTAEQCSSTLSLGVSWPLTPSCWSCCRAPRWSCRLWEARPTWVATPWATSSNWLTGGRELSLSDSQHQQPTGPSSQSPAPSTTQSRPVLGTAVTSSTRGTATSSTTLRTEEYQHNLSYYTTIKSQKYLLFIRKIILTL